MKALVYFHVTLKQKKGLASFTLDTLASTKFFCVFDFFFYSLWLPRYLKKCPNETTKRFLVGNTRTSI